MRPVNDVDDHHLAVLDQVVDVPLVEVVRPQALVDGVQDLDVFDVVEVADREQLLGPGHAVVGQGDGMGLLVDQEVAGGPLGAGFLSSCSSPRANFGTTRSIW